MADCAQRSQGGPTKHGPTVRERENAKERKREIPTVLKHKDTKDTKGNLEEKE
jgi:hypothetical protein